jgi:hypothetical protein
MNWKMKKVRNFQLTVNYLYFTSNYKLRGGFMELNGKMVGYILYAVGIIGGVEGAIDPRQQNGILISIIAMVVIIIASYMLDKK